MTHTHSTSTLDWGLSRIGSHLSTEHGMTVPMAWTVGQMHEAHLKAHQMAHAAVPTPPEEEPMTVTMTMINPSTENAARTERPQVREDRVICALAGIDFDRDFVPDDAVNLRGTLRTAYGKQAAELLKAVDRGHLSDLVAPTGALDAMQSRLDDANQALRSSERHRAELERRLEQATTGNQRNIASIDALEADLADARDERDRAQERLMEKLTEAAALREERDRAITAGRHLEQQRDAARVEEGRAIRLSSSYLAALEEAREELETERSVIHELEEVNESFRSRTVSLESRLADKTRYAEEIQAALDDARNGLQQAVGYWQEQAERVKRVLTRRTQALDEGRKALMDIVAEMREDYANDISPNVLMLADALAEIAGGTVSTAKPIGMKCQQPHLGLATTGEMLTEITTRIDLGHCGLDYRTVDSE